MQAWQDRFRDPGLTVLLVLQLSLIFFAAPLAAKGLPIARQAGQALVLAMVVIVVMLSRNRSAIALMLLGMAAILAGLLLGWGGATPPSTPLPPRRPISALSAP